MTTTAEKVREKFRLLSTRQKNQAVLDRSKWESVKDSWIEATSFIDAMISRGVTNKRIDEETKKLRVLSCHGNGADIQPCRARALGKDDLHYCNLCGCGEKYIARLDGEGYTKLDYPRLMCPLKKKGFSNWEGTENELV